MRITIEREQLVYIYLLDIIEKPGIVEKSMAFVDGRLIYDYEGNWIGIGITKNGKGYTFEGVKFNDEIEPSISIEDKDEFIFLRFEVGSQGSESMVEQGFNIDLIEDRVYGIEIILQKGNTISKRKMPLFDTKSHPKNPYFL